MADTSIPDLISYVDASKLEWQEFRSGSRRKTLHEDAETGQLAMLVQWDAGYRMGLWCSGVMQITGRECRPTSMRQLCLGSPAPLAIMRSLSLRHAN